MAHKNRLYPHLLPDSIIIWERWLKEYQSFFTRFDYDVRVGQGRDPGPDFEDNIRKDGLDLSKRRIDAVGFTPNHITIIEITPIAGIKCIGQVFAYPILYQETFNPTLPLRTLIVAETLGTDVLPALRAHKLPYNLV